MRCDNISGRPSDLSVFAGRPGAAPRRLFGVRLDEAGPALDAFGDGLADARAARAAESSRACLFFDRWLSLKVKPSSFKNALGGGAARRSRSAFSREGGAKGASKPFHFLPFRALESRLIKALRGARPASIFLFPLSARGSRPRFREFRRRAPPCRLEKRKPHFRRRRRIHAHPCFNACLARAPRS